jgi:hypothetical protein
MYMQVRMQDKLLDVQPLEIMATVNTLMPSRQKNLGGRKAGDLLVLEP